MLLDTLENCGGRGNHPPAHRAHPEMGAGHQERFGEQPWLGEILADPARMWPQGNNYMHFKFHFFKKSVYGAK